MPQVVNSACLYTTVKNISGQSRFFGYLNPRGTLMAPGEVLTIPGDLATTLAVGWSRTKFNALLRSLETNKSLEIISTPAVHLYDPVAERTRMLAVQNGMLGLVDPCWDSSGSSEFSDA